MSIITVGDENLSIEHFYRSQSSATRPKTINVAPTNISNVTGTSSRPELAIARVVPIAWIYGAGRSIGHEGRGKFGTSYLG